MYSMLKLGKEKPHWSGLLYEWINYCTMALQSFTSSSFLLKTKLMCRNSLLFIEFFSFNLKQRTPFIKKKSTK